MFVAPLLGAALFIAVATDPLHDAVGDARLSLQEKAAATEPLVRSARSASCAPSLQARAIEAESTRKSAISLLIPCPPVSRRSEL